MPPRPRRRCPAPAVARGGWPGRVARLAMVTRVTAEGDAGSSVDAREWLPGTPPTTVLGGSVEPDPAREVGRAPARAGPSEKRSGPADAGPRHLTYPGRPDVAGRGPTSGCVRRHLSRLAFSFEPCPSG